MVAARAIQRGALAQWRYLVALHDATDALHW